MYIYMYMYIYIYILGLPIPRWKKILWTDNSTEEYDQNTSSSISMQVDKSILNENINDNAAINTAVICGGDNIVCDDNANNTSMQVDKSIVEKNINDNADGKKFGFITYLKFIVAREEKYVQSFRIPSLIQNNEASQKDIYFAYQYAMRDFHSNNNNDSNNDNNKNNDKNGYNNNKNNDNKSNNNSNNGNNNKDIIIQQNKQNNDFFISLMESFIQQYAPSLSFQTMLTVLLVPCGRGI
jgi:hypothetical protein